MTLHTTWNIDGVRKCVSRAAQAAVDETTREAAARARIDHPEWTDRTGRTSASIQPEPAQPGAHGVIGGFGSSLLHLFFLEIGFYERPGARTLRRAAAAEFSQLAGRVARHYRDDR